MATVFVFSSRSDLTIDIYLRKIIAQKDFKFIVKRAKRNFEFVLVLYNYEFLNQYLIELLEMEFDRYPGYNGCIQLGDYELDQKNITTAIYFNNFDIMYVRQLNKIKLKRGLL